MEPGYFDGVGSQLSALAAAGAHQSTTRRPRMRLPRIAPGLALAGSLLVVVAVVGVVLAVRPDRQGGAATGGATTGRIDPSLVRNYAILRRPSVGTDRLPTDVLDRLTPTVRAQNGLLPSRSRRIPLPGQVVAWVVPGSSGLCLYATSAVAGSFLACTAPSPATVAGAVAGHDDLAVGLVPDRIRSLAIWNPVSRQARSVPLAYGLFAANYAVGESLVTGTPGSERPVWPALTARFVRVGSVPLVPSRGPAPFGGTPIAQINLQPSGPPTAGAPGGVAEILATKQGQGLPGKSGAVLGITITATNVPRLSGREAYAVWLTGNRSGRGRSTPALLGFVNPGPDRAGRLHTAGTLPRDVGRFSTILITIEHAARPRSPTRVVLQAALIGIRFPSP